MPGVSNGKSWFLTRNGIVAIVREPEARDIQATDIAASLSKICRFNGHCRDFYSVAQHSVLVGTVARPAIQFAALMHDAHEAYVQDVIAPLKWEIGNAYRSIEKAWEKAVARRFSIELTEADRAEIKLLDMRMLATERRDLLSAARSSPPWEPLNEIEPFDFRIEPWAHEDAQKRFLRAFAQYAYAVCQ